MKQLTEKKSSGSQASEGCRQYPLRRESGSQAAQRPAQAQAASTQPQVSAYQTKVSFIFFALVMSVVT